MTVETSDQAVLTRLLLAEDVEIMAGVNRDHASLLVEAIFECMTEALQAGDKVEVRGFGSFRRRQRRARRGRNPRTGAAVEVPAKSVVYFTPSEDMKRRVALTNPAGI